MFASLKALEGYTNSRGLLPGLALIHVLPEQMAWAGDGDVELWLFQHQLPTQDKRWDVNAAQLVALVRAAGDKAEITVQEDQGEVFIAGQNFEGTTALVKDDSPSLWEIFDQEAAIKVPIENSAEFTTALGTAAKYAAKEGNAGAYWMAVVLRGGHLWASNQGYGFAKVTLDHPVEYDEDVLIPARACQAALDSAMTVNEFLIDNNSGLGAFLLNDGAAAIVFRLVPVEKQYPDLEKAVAGFRPKADAVWADALLIQNELPRVSLASDGKLSLIELKPDQRGWLLYTAGHGEASVALPLFRPDASAEACTLPLKRWQQMMEAAAEVLPLKSGVWFRAGFAVEGGRCILEGMEMAFVAAEPEPKKEKAKKEKAATKEDKKPKKAKA